jgi:hypothetical protein
MTPLTATVHTVAARRSGSSTRGLRPVAIDETQERFDVLERRGNDGQAVGILVLVEIPVDLLEAAAHDDIARTGLRGIPFRCRRDGEVVDDRLRRDFQDVALELLGGLVADVAGHRARWEYWACRARPTSRPPAAETLHK